MSRTLAQIKTEISTRFQSKEFVPHFIERSTDFVYFSNAIGEFIAPYIKQLEDFLEIWNDVNLLKNFLLRRNMFLTGNEDLAALRIIAQDRLKILSRRGTNKMIDEIKRLVNESSITNLEHKEAGNSGWVLGKTSPGYRASINVLNLAYLNMKKVLIFNLKNQNSIYTNEEIKNIINKYFSPKHIKVLFNFI